MALYGTFSSMPLPELLQWIGATGRTGGLHVQRDKVCTRIYCRDGRIVACSSDDPPTRLGQYLLYRGKISKDILQQAMARQEETGKALGVLLVEMGVLSGQELTHYMTAKAEETVLGLFAWEDAVFRFDDKLASDPSNIQISLPMDEVLERGEERLQDMKRIREVFPDEGIVLAHTERRPKASFLGNPMAKRIYEMLDGQRTMAEVLLHTHGSEFLAKKFLYQLYKKGLLRVVEARKRPLDDGGPKAAIARARELMERGNFEAALKVLDEACCSYPDSEALRAHVARTEAAFLDHCYRHGVPPNKVPVLVQAGESLGAESLLPTEFFLLSLIREGDCAWDVKSLIWIAPMRAVEVVLTLNRLLEAGLVELQDPAQRTLGSSLSAAGRGSAA
jgi:hypothetical protein